jgi:hypothetical protein
LAGLDLREHGTADERIDERKNRHNRLKVLFHFLIHNASAVQPDLPMVLVQAWWSSSSRRHWSR